MIENELHCQDPHAVETFGPLTSILVLGHGGHGKGTFCKLLEDVYGLRSMSSSQAALPFIFPALQAAFTAACGRPVQGTPEDAYAVRGGYRKLWKALISLYNTPDKTTLSRQILSQVPVYDGMRCAEEFAASRALFNHVFWVDASKRKGPDPSMGIERTDDMILIDNNGSLEDLSGQVRALEWLRNG